MEKISRKQAVQLGLKRYFTGVPCMHGHICERRIKKDGSSQCVECHRLTLQKQKARDPERFLLRARLSKQEQRARDPERFRRQWREWYARQKAKKQEISL